MSKLKEIRLLKGLRKEHLAVAAGCSAVYIERLESNRATNPSIKIAGRIAALLGVRPEEIWPVDPVVTPDESAAPAVRGAGRTETA